MAQVELIMPKMGESIMEATILKWHKNAGDKVELDETILEIATDKVDTEIPSPVSGVVSEILFSENDVVPIGKVIAIIATEGEEASPTPSPAVETKKIEKPLTTKSVAKVEKTAPQPVAVSASSTSNGARFYSPLVKNIAKKENISLEELDSIQGSGHEGRVTKTDILNYISSRTSTPGVVSNGSSVPKPSKVVETAAPLNVGGDNVEIVEMDRMRKIIADHMVMSKRTSPHVTSFVEVDVTNLVNWRNRVKNEFQKKYGQKITFTPIFIEAVVKALKDYPLVNVSVDGQKIIVKKDINIGMAAALPSGNLIVPVIKNADNYNLIGLAKIVNDLAGRARTNNLKPQDIQDGTFTITNVGTFGNTMGTPIINQPQAAILATGAIKKKPAVLETEYGDVIAVRQLMFLSLSYDHRIVDGFLGGSFLRKVGDYLENFDHEQNV
jgi:2-oxoglutarate dehydrogenase E2 component (dihydrolipoamide succinyltransferase)